jgi:type III pantothenate kinase
MSASPPPDTPRRALQSTAGEFLALDLGNSALKALRTRRGASAERLRLDAGGGPELWERELAGLLADHPSVGLCSVSPSREAALVAWLEGRGARLCRIRGDSPAPFAVLVRRRATLGADRLCNAAAAWGRGLAPALVLDVGSAMTLDLLDGRGRYAGGLIFPGESMLLDAMAAGGERLPRAEAGWTASPVGAETDEALRAGASWGLLGAAEGLVRRLRAQLGAPCPAVLTGGGAGELARRWREGECRLEPDWTLEGLRLLCAGAAGAGAP